MHSLRPKNTRYPEIRHIKIPDKLNNIKVFPMNALLAELPVTHLRPMASSSYVWSTWFYVVFILAVTITLGLCIKKLKIIKKLGGICCGGYRSGCRKRGSDGDEKDSSEDVSYCCVNLEKRTSSETNELKPTVKDQL